VKILDKSDVLARFVCNK